MISDEPLKNRIVGAWRLLSWVYQNEAGDTIDYFGKNPTGILMYDTSGNMNAQLMQRERSLFQTQAMRDGTDSERVDAFQTYVAYYGKYDEPTPGEIVHVVEGSLFPNWIGSKQIRYGSIKDDKLTLRTPLMQTANGGLQFTLVWQRIA